MDAFAPIRSDPQLDALTRLLADGDAPVTAEGMWGSSAPIVAALAAARLGRPLLLVIAHADDADHYRDDIETVLGAPPELLPQLESTPTDNAAADELAGERLRLCLRLMALDRRTGWDASFDGAVDVDAVSGAEDLGGGGGYISIVAPILALMQPVATPESIAEQSLSIQVGDTQDPDRLADWLISHGFELCDQVETPGDYSRRGGIIDIYSNAQTEPVRIEFFGDEVESIRFFDAGTQRSARRVDAVQVPALCVASDAASTAGQRGAQTTSFLALLPENTLIALYEPGDIQELGRTYLQRLGERAGIIPVESLFRRANAFTQLHLERFNKGGPRSVGLPITSLPQFEPKAPDALRGLAELTDAGDVFVICDNPPEQQRFHELLDEQFESPPERVHTRVGVIHRGFRWGTTTYVPHHEVFGRYRQRRTLRRVATGRPIDTFLDLNPGDYVVHVLNGIGRFQGLKTIEREGRREEYLAVEFAQKAVLHVPVSQIHVVQKYIGGFRGKPKLSKLGGTAWKRTKDRVADAVTDLAAELLAIQAQRATESGIAYPGDTDWQREFEGAFLYDETEDQLRAIDDVKHDMLRPRPMDRLLCGDVGYGKTEIAMRAAFKIVEFGKQVAVLVPTTVLAEQHFETFRERLADYPFTVEALSRFRTKKEQGQIVERAAKGAGGHPHRYAPLAVKGCALRRSRPGDHRRGAAFRRRGEGTAQAIAGHGRGAHAQRDARSRVRCTWRCSASATSPRCRRRRWIAGRS